MPWLSLQAWQVVVFWLWAVTAVGGGIAIVAALGSSVISYFISDATQTAAGKEIASANKEAARANERAATLETDAAQSRLKVEELAANNLALRQEIIRVEQPRGLGAGSYETLKQLLSDVDSKALLAIRIIPQSVSMEQINFAGQLVELFKDAGFQADGGGKLPNDTGYAVNGIGIVFRRGKYASVGRRKPLMRKS